MEDLGISVYFWLYPVQNENSTTVYIGLTLDLQDEFDPIWKLVFNPIFKVVYIYHPYPPLGGGLCALEHPFHL